MNQFTIEQTLNILVNEVIQTQAICTVLLRKHLESESKERSIAIEELEIESKKEIQECKELIWELTNRLSSLNLK